MKTRTRIIAWLLMMIIGSSTPSFAADTTSSFEAVAADVILARPLWLVATVIGTGLFVVSLPVAAMSKSVDKTARTLVEKPARATFTRPLGAFSTLD